MKARGTFRRRSLATGLAALAALAAAGAAHACSDRPGTPNNIKVEPALGREATALRVSWTNTASQRVWWDFEVTDQAGRAVKMKGGMGGIGPAATTKGTTQTKDFVLNKSGTTRCFRIRARTGPFASGCVSEQWSARVCSTTAGPPAPEKGPWGALAADGKGAWGYAVKYASEAQARDAARKGCGNARCTVKVAGPVGCYAYFESRTNGYWYGLALHSTGATANQVARSGCEKGAPAGTCKLVKTNCGS
jgi:hypothetical protein